MYGSLAGTPLADVVYALAMARILVMQRNSFDSEGLTPCFTSNGNSFKFYEASFHDDVIVLFA